jgi:phosphohistidine phosphatase
MHRLIVLRHAKAVNPFEAPDDHQRGLTPRGRSDAALMGAHLADIGWRPDRVIGSDASRVVQTWASAKTELGTPELSLRPILYLAEANQWHALTHQVLAGAPAPQTLMLIGHNPGLHAFAMACAKSEGAGANAHAASLYDGLPTCAAALFLVATSDNPSEDRFQLHAFVTPRRLREAGQIEKS